jgi:hypothetical protein
MKQPPLRALALMLIILLGAACGTTSPLGTATPMPATPSASPTVAPSAITTSSDIAASASPSPTITPTTASTPSAAVLQTDSIAEVVTDGLLVRTQPGVADDSGKLKPLLSRRTRVYVVDGPARASGYDWYLIRPFDDSLPSGWVAAGDHDGTPWLGATHIDCPKTPTLNQLGGMDRHVALACYGAREFHFQGILTSPVASCGVWWSTEPPWLDDCYAAHFLAADKGAGNPGLDGTPAVKLRLSPAVERQAAIPDQPYGMFLPVRVVGRFDDPAATSCRLPAGEASVGAPPRAIIVLDCRAEFVGTTVQLMTGTDAIDLPVPELVFAGTEGYTDASNNSGTRVLLDVANWGQYPAALFTPASDLLPCGLNTDAARTWVDIWDAAHSTDLGSFCGLREPKDLLGIWVAVPRGTTPPASVYLTLTDRRTGAQVRSNTVVVAPFP